MEDHEVKQYKFIDAFGTFRMEQPENTSYLYFPLAGEQGMKASLTPLLGGDLKRNQNEFILQPVSAEDLHNNKSTRNFWCYIEGKGCWSASGASAEAEAQRFTGEQEESVLTAGPMWHQIERRNHRYHLASRIISFVPAAEYSVEIMHVEIKNEGEDTIHLTPTAAVPMYGRSADNIRDHRHVTSLLHRAETIEKGILLTPSLSFDERGHQLNHITYYVCGMEMDGQAPAGFKPVAEDYIGEGGSYLRPRSVVDDQPYDTWGRHYDGYEIVGALRFAGVQLQPGESRSYTVFIGAEEGREQIEQMLEEYSTEESIQKAFKQTRTYWQEKINVSYETGDKNFDNFMYWVNFQPMLRRIYGCSFLPHHDYGKGGRGWRDLWQDCLALLIMNPEGVRQMLIDNFAGVRIDGSNATIIGNRQGEFIADRNNITRVWMDHGLWPLMTTKLYIDQTGDSSILLKEAPYFKDKQEARGTRTDTEWNADAQPVLMTENGRPYYGTILEHLLIQNLTVFYEVGEHNHMRLRGADWNDALDMAQERGESVAFTAAYSNNLRVLAELIRLLREEKQIKTIELAQETEPLFTMGTELYEDGEQKKKLLSQYCESCYHSISGRTIYADSEKVIDSLLEKAEWIQGHIRRDEWIQEDEECGWFNSYYDDHGQKCEGRTEHGVRMMLTGQVFTVMSGTATREQTAKIIKAADKYLYKEKLGGYRLNTDFRELKTDLGRMFGFAYGHKENGAVFSHMTTMFGNALYKQGFAAEGYKALNALYQQAVCFESSRIYPGIPEYFNDRGRGMYHYLTGAASWLMLTVITEMFGIKGSNGAMVLEPKLLRTQFTREGKAGIRLRFGDRSWYIVYVNTKNKEYGEYQIGPVYLDGNQREGNGRNYQISLGEIHELDKSMVHEVIVELK